MRILKFTRILFYGTMLLFLLLGIAIPNSNLTASITSAAIILVLIVIDIRAPKIAKLSVDNPKVKTMRFLIRLVTSIIIISAIFTVLSPGKQLFSAIRNEMIIIGLISLVMMIFGYLIPKIPFNRVLGLRLPWTVKDEDTWKIAHKILGYLSFPIAVIMFTSSFFLKPDIVLTTCILTWIIIPGLYSLFFFYKKKRQ